MPVSPARKIAYQILLPVEAGRDFAVDLLQRPEVSALADRDRRLATEIVMGVLRWRGELDFQVARLSARAVTAFDTEVLSILRMGIYQIRFLERVPKRAVVNDAVELAKLARKRSAAGLVNAVLRKCEPEPGLGRGDFSRLSAESRNSVRRAVPEWLLGRWAADNDQTNALHLAYCGLRTPPTTLRVVDSDADVGEVRGELELEGVRTSGCRYAVARGLTVVAGQVQRTRAFQAGRIVIQDEASQLVGELVSPDPGMRVLDLCAAPGIKAGQLAQTLRSGTLVACDRSAARLAVMARLLPRWVPAAVQMSMARIDAARPLPFGAKFDRILLDAPCSGTGTLARNPEIKWRLQAEDIARLANLQALMLRNALPALAKGGQLIYATCSLEPEENAGVVDKVLQPERSFRLLTSQELAEKHPSLKALVDSRGFLRTRPHLHSMDGFSAAVIVRTGD